MIGSCALVLTLSLLVGDGTDVVVRTDDGRLIEGSITLQELVIKTIFGEATIKVSELRIATFGKTDFVVTRLGTVFRGRVALETLRLRSGGEIIELKKKEIASLMVPSPAPTAMLDKVVATFRRHDGTEVKGTPSPTVFSMVTTFGRAEIDLAKTKSIRFGKTDVVVTTEDTILKGNIEPFVVKVATSDGAVTLEREHLAEITVERP